MREKNAALTTSMRLIGVGTPGGAEALAIFHQLLHDEWMTGSLREPLARTKVDEKNCFGMTEWKAVRDAASRFLPEAHSRTPSGPRGQVAGIGNFPAWWAGKAHRCPRHAGCVAEKWRLGGSVVHGRRRHHLPTNPGVAFSAGCRRRQCQSRSRAEPTEKGSHLLRERPGCSATRVEN